MTTHRLLIVTRPSAPEMVEDAEMVLVDFASYGREYYWKAHVRQILRVHFPVLANRLDAEGLVDVILTMREFDIFNQALRVIQPVGCASQ